MHVTQTIEQYTWDLSFRVLAPISLANGVASGHRLVLQPTVVGEMSQKGLEFLRYGKKRVNQSCQGAAALSESVNICCGFSDFPYSPYSPCHLLLRIGHLLHLVLLLCSSHALLLLLLLLLLATCIAAPLAAPSPAACVPCCSSCCCSCWLHALLLLPLLFLLLHTSLAAHPAAPSPASLTAYIPCCSSCCLPCCYFCSCYCCC